MHLDEKATSWIQVVSKAQEVTPAVPVLAGPETRSVRHFGVFSKGRSVAAIAICSSHLTKGNTLSVLRAIVQPVRRWSSRICVSCLALPNDSEGRRICSLIVDGKVDVGQRGLKSFLFGTLVYSYPSRVSLDHQISHE